MVEPPSEYEQRITFHLELVRAVESVERQVSSLTGVTMAACLLLLLHLGVALYRLF